MTTAGGGQRQLKVLHVLDVLRPSGAETCLKVAGPMWAAHGISCDVLATGEELGNYARPLFDAGYRTAHLPLSDRRQFVEVFPRLIRSEGYDVVHTHVEGANFYVDMLARWAGAGVVQHVHNVFAFEGRLRRERTVQRRILRRLGVPFLGVSQDVVDNERDRYGITAQLFLNWADLRAFAPPDGAQRSAAREAFGLDDTQFAVVSVANCHDFKNHVAVIDALTELPEHVVWLHVGHGGLEDVERRAATAAGVEHRIRFLGQRDPLGPLHAADAFVMPSLYEGQGISAIEALSTGLPSVLSDVAGLRNLREMGVPAHWSGIDGHSVATQLRRILDGDLPTGELAKMNRTFSPERAVPELAAVYRGVS